MFECIHESTRTDPREPGLWINNQRVGPPIKIVETRPNGKLLIEVQHGGNQLRREVVDPSSEKSFADAGLYRTRDYQDFLKTLQPT